METPDGTTRDQLQGMAREALDKKPGCKAAEPTFSFRTTQMGTRKPEIPADDLADLGMTSNCYREGNDPNVATHHITDGVSSTVRMSKDMRPRRREGPRTD